MWETNGQEYKLASCKTLTNPNFKHKRKEIGAKRRQSMDCGLKAFIQQILQIKDLITPELWETQAVRVLGTYRQVVPFGFDGF